MALRQSVWVAVIADGGAITHVGRKGELYSPFKSRVLRDLRPDGMTLERAAIEFGLEIYYMETTERLYPDLLAAYRQATVSIGD